MTTFQPLITSLSDLLAGRRYVLLNYLGRAEYEINFVHGLADTLIPEANRLTLGPPESRLFVFLPLEALRLDSGGSEPEPHLS